MFGAYVKENRKALIALAVYTVVFALVFWLYRLPLGAAGYAALVCLFLLALWFAVDYRRFAARLRLLQRTVLREFPLYCPKCRRESVISARNFQIETVYQPDAKTQC